MRASDNDQCLISSRPVTYARKVVLHCPNGYQAQLDAMVEDFLRAGVLYVGVVGMDCVRVEDIIDELVVGNGSAKPRFMLTASHPGGSVSDAIALAKSLTVEYGGRRSSLSNSQNIRLMVDTLTRHISGNLGHADMPVANRSYRYAR
jgi:hypothetical protein